MRTAVLAIPALLALGACDQQKQQQQAPQPQSVQAGGAPFAYAKLAAMPKAADGADGSGCLADTNTGPLPDGIWFGYAKAWTATSLEFDAACWFSGAEATAAATAHNDESPPPNGFFVANDGAGLRTIPVAPAATALRVTNGVDGGIENQNTTYPDMVANPGTYTPCPGDACSVWVAVNGGIATEVSMQYVP